MSNGTFNLFVYGTLKAGGSNAHLMKDCEHLGQAQVLGMLYDIDGQHPALVLYGKKPVQGEIWCCPWELLAGLDEFEGVHTGLFRRVGVNVRSQRSETLACWVYVAGPALAPKLTPARRTTNWKQRVPYEPPAPLRSTDTSARSANPRTGHS